MKMWLGKKRLSRYLGVLALVAFPLVMLEQGPVHAWRQWKELFWEADHE